jgi:hypothetical protein
VAIERQEITESSMGPDALFEAMMGYVHWIRLQAAVREEHRDSDEVQA